MKRLLARLLINALALWLAARFVPGIQLTGGLLGVVVVALVFGVVNALIKPVVRLLAFPFILATLGLFTLVINALMLLLTAVLTDALSIEGFLPALVGGLLISVVSFLLSLFVSDERKRRKRERKAKR